ncbi:UBX domain-containing protein 11 [Holothuria leucospilota]|uniref:UBX domain-containing protein 11 n=1 Tax=Holothuria leucospilota TaxID=206669 RepID=A0A9Q1BIS0_HOLLE|nr:UBX domain-containing protein 11 [Holothuria leucospilota]
MSSPNANLKKGKRTPLPGVGKRQVPFRNASSLSITDKILEDALRPTSQQSSRSEGSVHKGRPHLPKLDRHSNKDNSSAPTDFDLMNGMMGRISKLELQVQYYAKEIMEKDKKISILEEKVKLKERYSSMGNHDDSNMKIKELEKKCSELQNHIKEMEDFLSDYGMIFVGNTSPGSEVDGVYEELSVGKDSVWRPDTSVAHSRGFQVDFDKVVKNVRELNILGGEGEKRVQHTVKGAKLTTKEPIPLTLYANGIFMFNGPFRSFDNPETQQCIQDLMDGFFPSELQGRYPDGVPIQLSDQRDTVFRDSRSREHFPGAGQLLGGEQIPSRLVPTNLDKTTNTDMDKDGTTHSHAGRPLHQTSKPPGIQMSMDQFLNKLPSSVMKDGKVINIRSGVADNMKDKSESCKVTVIETPAVSDVRENISSTRPITSGSRPSSSQASRITTLRIKSESGNHTFIVKMKYEDKIRDLRNYLNQERSSDAPDYELITTFPNKCYNNLDLTLEECGLTPNATVHLKAK